jgi:VanZ family protein
MSFLHRIPRPLLLAAFWTAVIGIAVLALVPGSTPLPTTGWDKSNHALAFFTLALLGSVCWPRSAVRVCIAIALYGGLIEVAQTLTPTRDGEWLDWFADMVGIALAALGHFRSLPTKRPAAPDDDRAPWN